MNAGAARCSSTMRRRCERSKRIPSYQTAPVSGCEPVPSGSDDCGLGETGRPNSVVPSSASCLPDCAVRSTDGANALGPVLGTAENLVHTAVFRLRTAVLYCGIPRLDRNIYLNDVMFTNPYEGASDNNNETAYSVHFMNNHRN